MGVGWKGALSREPGKNSASGNILTAAEGLPAGETSSLPAELGPPAGDSHSGSCRRVG